MAFTSSVPSSSSTPRWAHDVFLSFKGENTYFIDNLYAGLKQKGISTFRVDEKLKQGAINTSELLKAIEESRVAIVILSKDYASSRWCLIELAKIVECMEKMGLVVLPVFHYVDPNEISHQKGTFANAFAKLGNYKLKLDFG
ncbi:TMV resistance protein N-like [Quercus suber]|uniref:TMV resistance protein N-like n=1 Tax=Quercus suber TaxID=58331 RepID=UPI000CE24422|nr:TMV resistance protein N-like [Quercus suber]